MESRNLQLPQRQNPNPRAHIMLFQQNTPFRPKRVESKVQYRRKPKHQEQRYE